MSNFESTSKHVILLYDLYSDFKGVPMLDWGSAFGDETLTIRIAILENLDMLGRKYRVGHLDENMANFRFFDRGHFGSIF